VVDAAEDGPQRGPSCCPELLNTSDAIALIDRLGDNASGHGRAGVVAPETLVQLTDAPEPHVIWLRAAAGANPLELVDALDGLADAAGGQLEDRLQAQVAANRERDMLAGAVLGCWASRWRSP
jgi:hypothetical protein